MLKANILQLETGRVTILDAAPNFNTAAPNWLIVVRLRETNWKNWASPDQRCRAAIKAVGQYGRVIPLNKNWFSH